MSGNKIKPQPPRILDENRGLVGFRDGTIYVMVQQRDTTGRLCGHYELRRTHPRRHILKKQIKQMRKENGLASV